MLRADALKADPLPPLSFAVRGGECLAIEGPSGVGKTRLLRALADLDDARGHVFLDGAERREMPATEWRRRVRYASAEPAWWTPTARGAFTPMGKSLPLPRDSEKLNRLLTAVGLTTASLDKPIADLSTGERRRLALIRALIDEPSVLLLDEPTIGLDAQSAALVEELVRFQVLSGRTVIFTSHDEDQIERLAHLRLQLARPATVPRVQPA